MALTDDQVSRTGAAFVQMSRANEFIQRDRSVQIQVDVQIIPEY